MSRKHSSRALIHGQVRVCSQYWCGIQARLSAVWSECSRSQKAEVLLQAKELPILDDVTHTLEAYSGFASCLVARLVS